MLVRNDEKNHPMMDPCIVYLYIYIHLHEWLVCMVNFVGNFTCPVDLMVRNADESHGAKKKSLPRERQ